MRFSLSYGQKSLHDHLVFCYVSISCCSTHENKWQGPPLSRNEFGVTRKSMHSYSRMIYRLFNQDQIANDFRCRIRFKIKLKALIVRSWSNSLDYLTVWMARFPYCTESGSPLSLPMFLVSSKPAQKFSGTKENKSANPRNCSFQILCT